MASDYGYDLYLPSLINAELGSPRREELDEYKSSNLPALASAAWELCRMGMLRPSVNASDEQGVNDGFGYSITLIGERWLAESEKDPFIAMEPSQIGAMLSRYGTRFGNGYLERSREAMRCYQANAHLACCAMCGAAAESVLLGVAFAKGDRTKVIKEYLTKGGRGRVQSFVFGNAPEFIRDQAAAGLSLLKYWRDDAAHGEFAGLSEPQAFTSTLLLLRLTSFANDHWDVLTKKIP
jgi:hypothetical protein